MSLGVYHVFIGSFVGNITCCLRIYSLYTTIVNIGVHESIATNTSFSLSLICVNHRGCENC